MVRYTNMGTVNLKGNIITGNSMKRVSRKTLKVIDKGNLREVDELIVE